MNFINFWTIGATVLMGALVPCGIVCVRGRTMPRVVGLELASVLSAFVLMLLARGFHRPSFIDIGLALALLSPPATLLYVHYLERWP